MKLSWVTNVLILSVCFAVWSGTGVTKSIADDKNELLKQYKEFWEKLSATFAANTIELTSVTGSTADPERTWQVQADGAWTWELLHTDPGKGPTLTTCTLSNDKYFATLRRRGDGPWNIAYLGTRLGEASQEGTINAHSLFMTQICDPGGLATALANEELIASFSPPDTNKEYAEFRIVQELPKDAKMMPAYAGGTIRITGDPTHYPKRIDVVGVPAPPAPLGTRLSYDDFTEVDGIMLPSVVHTQFLRGLDAPDKETTDFHYDYSHIRDPIDRKKCYFTYYGLPEPGVHNDWPLGKIVVAIGVLLLIGTLAWLSRAAWKNRAGVAS